MIFFGSRLEDVKEKWRNSRFVFRVVSTFSQHDKTGSLYGWHVSSVWARGKLCEKKWNQRMFWIVLKSFYKKNFIKIPSDRSMECLTKMFWCTIYMSSIFERNFSSPEKLVLYCCIIIKLFVYERYHNGIELGFKVHSHVNKWTIYIYIYMCTKLI